MKSYLPRSGHISFTQHNPTLPQCTSQCVWKQVMVVSPAVLTPVSGIMVDGQLSTLTNLVNPFWSLLVGQPLPHLVEVNFRSESCELCVNYFSFSGSSLFEEWFFIHVVYSMLFVMVEKLLVSLQRRYSISSLRKFNF